MQKRREQGVRNMLRIASVPAIAYLLVTSAGCSKSGTEYSAVLHDDVNITEKRTTPSQTIGFSEVGVQQLPGQDSQVSTVIPAGFMATMASKDGKLQFNVVLSEEQWNMVDYRQMFKVTYKDELFVTHNIIGQRKDTFVKHVFLDVSYHADTNLQWDASKISQ